MRAGADRDIRAALGLDPTSRVLVFNTEGATDPDRYAELVGLRPEAIAAGIAGEAERPST